MVTHLPLPAAYHIGEQRDVGKGVVKEERHVFLKLMVVGVAALLAMSWHIRRAMSLAQGKHIPAIP